MSRLKQIWVYVSQHKYVITIGIFVLIVGVLDENSLIRRLSHWNEIRMLKSEIERYRKQYEEDSETLKELTSNPDALEKVAREKYKMKKENEDIFIFKDDLE